MPDSLQRRIVFANGLNAALVAQAEGASVLAGGTWVIRAERGGEPAPAALTLLDRIPELGEVAATSRSVTLGAALTPAAVSDALRGVAGLEGRRAGRKRSRQPCHPSGRDTGRQSRDRRLSRRRPGVLPSRARRRGRARVPPGAIGMPLDAFLEQRRGPAGEAILVRVHAGGVMPPPAGYWGGVERICRANDILLVADEVICGFGRLGTPFGCQRYGFTPDIMTLSKQITSSYMPLAAVMISDAVYGPIADNSAKIGVFGHGFTASGHPVSTAVALENLKIMEEEDWTGNAARLEVQFQDALQGFADHPLVGEARGAGLIGALELVADKATRRPFETVGAVGRLASAIGHDEGLIFRAIGDQLALCPPMIVTGDDVAEIMARMGRTLGRLTDAARTDGLL